MTTKLTTTKKKSKTATSKTITVGKQEYLNQETGVIETFNVVTQKDCDFNFQKIWLGYLLDSLDLIGNKKIKVMNYLLEHKNNDNQIIATQRVIADGCGVSLPTVNSTIQALIAIDAIKKVANGVLMLNPDIMFNGGNAKRMNILMKFNKIETFDE